jgi:integrase
MGKRRGRGEGSLEQLPSGSWRAEFSAGVNPDTDKPIRHKKTCKRKADAAAWLAEVRTRHDRNELAPPNRQTVPEWFAAWLDQKAAQVSAGTHKFYQDQQAKVGQLEGVRLSDLRRDRVAKWFADLLAGGTSATGVRRAATALNAALNEAMAQGILTSNPARRVKRPRVERSEVPCYTLEQARAVLTATDGHPWEAFVRLALDSGCRPGELYALRWEDVDLDAGAVRIVRTLERVGKVVREKPPKTAKGRRTILISAPTVDALREFRAALKGKRADSPLLFPGKRGTWLHHSNFSRRVWKPIAEAAGVPALGLYSLRHTSASLLLAAGAGIKDVSERLGHESIEITLRHYVHSLPSTQERVREIAGRIFFRSPHDLPTAAV